MTGSFGGILYMWIRYGKPDASMSGNAFLAGLVAITAPSGFVNPVAAAIIGLVAGVLVCLSCEFVERVLKVDDPVGAISVHGTNGIWGVIAVGLFADGKSNYGGSWNGVAGNVTGLFYGDAGQLVAQLMGVATLIGFVFVMSFVFNLFVDWFVGHRVSAKSELAGLDVPEMGAVAYPDFVLKPEPAMADVSGVSNMSTALATTDAPVVTTGASLPSVPWRDPHTVSPEDLSASIQRLEQACLAEPRSADLRTCLGMAYAMNYEVDKSMDALEAAVALDPDNFWAQLKYCGAALPAAGVEPGRRGNTQGPQSRGQFVAVVHRPQTAPGNPHAEAHMRSQRRVDEAADRAGARPVGDAPRDIRHHDVEMSWKTVHRRIDPGDWLVDQGGGAPWSRWPWVSRWRRSSTGGVQRGASAKR